MNDISREQLAWALAKHTEAMVSFGMALDRFSDLIEQNIESTTRSVDCIERFIQLWKQAQRDARIMNRN
jgi:hypothetical protein